MELRIEELWNLEMLGVFKQRFVGSQIKGGLKKLIARSLEGEIDENKAFRLDLNRIKHLKHFGRLDKAGQIDLQALHRFLGGHGHRKDLSLGKLRHIVLGRLREGQVAGKKKEILRSYFEGRGPEAEWPLLPALLNDFGHVGCFHEVRIGAKVDS
jgi:hypothetical protein